MKIRIAILAACVGTLALTATGAFAQTNLGGNIGSGIGRDNAKKTAINKRDVSKPAQQQGVVRTYGEIGGHPDSKAALPKKKTDNGKQKKIDGAIFKGGVQF